MARWMNNKTLLCYNFILYESHSKTYTVGTYSPGKLSVVYDISIHVLPTVPSPTTTHLIGLPEDICEENNKIIDYEGYDSFLLHKIVPVKRNQLILLPYYEVFLVLFLSSEHLNYEFEN